MAKSFVVTWTSVIDAESHLDAARLALAELQDPNTTANSFTVQEEGDWQVEHIDLEDEEDEEDPEWDGEGPALSKREIMAMSENAIKTTLHNLGYAGVDDLDDETATDKLLAYYNYTYED